ncbi:hypothetical protein V490_02658 [Pseudogymnoascus sp. VKM F-3557]|nr:hypothetical protein V490_02658 [Pseudogymnoascus sp. VKM F-3557]
MTKSTEDYQLPTRLIDLGSTPIRLVQSSDLTTKPHYAALSHCWGTLDFYKLKQDNLEDFMRAISKESPTKTFQDAIYIARSLSLQYLWIDSLCIIQGCDIDWHSESALMNSVYSGSTITIAAVGASDGTKGCFLKSPGYIGKVHFKPTIDEPLADRAWAVQERLLSPRTLHFSKTGLFWECRHCDASESFPGGSPAFEDQHMFHRDRKPVSEIWHIIIKLYTGSKLAFASDKMIAISGLAQQAFKENADQYLAGLWRKDIELQLLWYQQAPGRRLPPGSKYRAPSWSWASTDEGGSVSYVQRHEGYEIYFGEVKGGELRMSYSVMLVGQFKETRIFERGNWHTFTQLEINSSDNETEIFEVYLESDEFNGRDIYLLPVLEILGKAKLNKRDLQVLVVLPTGNNKGEYFRIGMIELLASDESHRKTQDRFLELLKLFGKATAEAQCAEVLEDPEFEKEQYVITIV